MICKTRVLLELLEIVLSARRITELVSTSAALHIAKESLHFIFTSKGVPTLDFNRTLSGAYATIASHWADDTFPEHDYWILYETVFHMSDPPKTFIPAYLSIV